MKAILISSIVAVMPMISFADNHATHAAKKMDAAATTATTTTDKAVTATKDAAAATTDKTAGAMGKAKSMAQKAKVETKATAETLKKDAKDAHQEMTK